MRKTFVTKMPDKAGAFLLASRIIAEAGGNITRVNYNRALDTHTLFLEVTATEPQLAEIESRLTDCGYLSDGEDSRSILMIVLTLPDVPGAIEPALELLGRHQVNISYISAQENGTPWQYFKMGLLIEDPDAVGRLIDALSRICEIRILDYEEHALKSGSDSQAAAYIHLMDSDTGRITYGVGVSSNITRASVRAIFSAVNRLQLGERRQGTSDSF